MPSIPIYTEENPDFVHFGFLVCIFHPYFQVLHEQLHTVVSFPPCGDPACLVLLMPHISFICPGEWSLSLG